MSDLNGKVFQEDGDESTSLESAPLSEKLFSAPLSVGAQLLTHREAKGWTVEQVANAIKLAPRQVEAIEADNFATLPGIAVTRGFVRSYAKLLRIDAVPLLAKMESATGTMALGNRVIATPLTSSRNASFRSKRSKRKTVGALALLAAVIATVIGYQKFGPLMPSFKTAGLDRTVDETKTATESVLPAAEPVAPSNTVGATDLAGSSAVVPDVVASSAAPATDDVPGQANDATVSAPQKSGNLLQITMKQDSWLEVRRAENNDVLAARLAKAGTVETFDVDSPIKLTVGNVAGVQAVLRGEPFVLKTATGGNVARITIK